MRGREKEKFIHLRINILNNHFSRLGSFLVVRTPSNLSSFVALKPAPNRTQEVFPGFQSHLYLLFTPSELLFYLTIP